MSLFVTAPGISGTYILCFSQSIKKLIVATVFNKLLINQVHIFIFLVQHQITITPNA